MASGGGARILNEEEERVKAEEERAMDSLMQLLDTTKFRTVDLFAALDTDHSGTIDKRELHATLASMGLAVSKHQTETLFSLLDVDGSGDITIAEFLARMRRLQLDRRAAAQAEARRSAIEARKMGKAEADRAAATKARLDGYEKLGRVDERPRSEKADQALMRIIQYIDENKLKMVDVFNRMDADESGFIDKHELQTTMSELGLDLSLEEAEQVCADLDVDGDCTVERAEFFKRYKELYRERRQASWRMQRRAKDSHKFRTMEHNSNNLKLDASSKRAWQWQPTLFQVPSIDSVANPAPAPVDLETLATAIERGTAGIHWPLAPAPCPAPAAPRAGGIALERPASAPAVSRQRRPFSASSRGSRPGSGARAGSARRTPGQPKPTTGGTKLATTITDHLALLKPEPVSSSAAANLAAEKKWKQNHVDALLLMLEQHKLKLADLFNEIDTDGSGAIDHDELRTLLMVMGVDVSDSEKLKVLFSLLDVDGDGEIELHEFLQRMQEIQKDRAVQKAGVSRRTPITSKHPMMQRKGENYREFKAKQDALVGGGGTMSDRLGSPRPASASARMQSPTRPARPLSATVRAARKKNAEAAVSAAAAAAESIAEEGSCRLPLADTHPNRVAATAATRASSKATGQRPPSAPHRHTEKLVAAAHARRTAERKASAGRIAIFAGVSIDVAVAALLRSKDDAAVATQMIMRDKLARRGQQGAAAQMSHLRARAAAAATATAPAAAAGGRPASAKSFVSVSSAAPTEISEIYADDDGNEMPRIVWQSTTAHSEQQRHRAAAAVATAAREAKEQRSGAWVPVGFHVDILEKQSMSNHRKQLSQ